MMWINVWRLSGRVHLGPVVDNWDTVLAQREAKPPRPSYRLVGTYELGPDGTHLLEIRDGVRS